MYEGKKNPTKGVPIVDLALLLALAIRRYNYTKDNLIEIAKLTYTVAESSGKDRKDVQKEKLELSRIVSGISKWLGVPRRDLASEKIIEDDSVKFSLEKALVFAEIHSLVKKRLRYREVPYSESQLDALLRVVYSDVRNGKKLDSKDIERLIDLMLSGTEDSEPS